MWALPSVAGPRFGGLVHSTRKRSRASLMRAHVGRRCLPPSRSQAPERSSHRSTAHRCSACAQPLAKRRTSSRNPWTRRLGSPGWLRFAPSILATQSEEARFRRESASSSGDVERWCRARTIPSGSSQRVRSAGPEACVLLGASDDADTGGRAGRKQCQSWGCCSFSGSWTYAAA